MKSNINNWIIISALLAPPATLSFTYQTGGIRSDVRTALRWRSSIASPSVASPPFTVLSAKKKQKKAISDIDLDALDNLDFGPDVGAGASPDQNSAKNKKKKKKNDPAASFDLSILEEDEPMSLKEKMALEKKAKKEAKKQQAQDSKSEQDAANNQQKNARAKAMKALEQMEADNGGGYAADTDKPKLSKKELKELKKKEDKEAAKMAKKEEKRRLKKLELGEDEDEDEDEEVMDIVNGDEEDVEVKEPEVVKETMEDLIRKNRPPPQIRVIPTSQPNFSSLRLEDVYITFRDQEVLRGVTWGVQTGDRVGLVGGNGGGKTTQLRILSGLMEPTAGDVVKSSQDLRVALLRQEFVDELDLERSLVDEFASVLVEENEILAQLTEAEDKLSQAGEDVVLMQEALDRLQELQNKAEDKDVYSMESRISKIMDVMGFTKEETVRPVGSFSGGWKMRIGLGKVLLSEPNVLLLDEPTNHLDLESVEWLEKFLINQKTIPMVICSHDREFLDRVCTKIVDTEAGLCQEYDGNYSRFLTLKKTRMDSWEASWKAQEKKIREEKAWINKFKIKQAQAAKQRQAKLDKITKSKDYVTRPPFAGKPFRFRFPDAPRLGPEVAQLTHVSHAYKTKTINNPLFDDVELSISRNDRIALLGPNGSGKSTLLRILMDREDPELGEAEIIGANVICNYFEQNQADVLDLSKTVIQTVQGASNGQSYNELRKLLGQFIFKGDAVEKKVFNLSGGEKARLSLCCMMLRPANFLVLDEPTNHLDIPAKEMLEEALQHYQGSVMVISHDRFFISKVATSIVAIEDKKLVRYGGDYKFYIDKSKEIRDKVEGRYVSGVERINSAPRIDLEAILAENKKKNFGGNKNAGMVTRKDKGVKNAKRQNEKA